MDDGALDLLIWVYNHHRVLKISPELVGLDDNTVHDADLRGKYQRLSNKGFPPHLWFP